MDKKKYKVIDLSGFGNSGKTALTNFFQEFSDLYWVSEAKFEFEMIRVKNGLHDLENAISNNWSPSRTSTTMYLFKQLVNDIGKNPKKYDLIGRLFNTGMRLDRRFNGKFIESSMDYYNKLIDMEYQAFNLYPFQNMSKFMMPIVKILELLNKREFIKETNILTVSDKNDFYELTKEYLNNLCKALDENDRANTIVLNNAIEPYSPEKGLDLFYDAKQIAVDRDPRDLYVSSKRVDEFVGKYHMGFSGSDNLENFIYRYRYLREKSPKKVYQTNDNLLKINFESLILDYDTTKNKIFKFINEDESIHSYPKKYFNPEVSKKGVGMWKNVEGKLKKDIEVIYSELNEYCLDI